MKNRLKSQDLELAFDVGHSSIGWAVLQNGSQLKIMGCGVVTFRPDDCLASKRRDFRRQRRHIRSTRQRIERMEKLLGGLNVLDKQDIAAKHRQAGGHPAPWLLAARVLAAKTEEEKKKARLSWPELWDVLRWYAHNRGYDGNIRWSGNFQVDAYSTSAGISAADVEKEAEEAAEAESTDGELEDSDSDKLAAGAKLMGEYGFQTSTFAETVAKILLGPERTVKLGQPGKPGKLDPTDKTFSMEEFRRKLFQTTDEFKDHPTHLRNYFKGIRAAFPRRVIKDIDGKRTLVGGTEWEVRFILRAHFGILPQCDDTFERAICGGLPETKSDWRAYEKTYPELYLSSKQDKEMLRKLRIPRNADKETERAIRGKRAVFLGHKLILPARYKGGLLFGQLGTRFHNRIISLCRFSYARLVDAISRRDEKVLAQYRVRVETILNSRRLSGAQAESDDELAHRWAAKLAKVSVKNSTDFLLYRWARKLADIRVNRAERESLTADERLAVHQRMKQRGFLSKVELEQAIIDATEGCQPTNLDQMFDATPEAADAFVISPVRKYLATNSLAKVVCSVLDKNLVARLAGKLRTKAVRISDIERWLSPDALQRLHQALEHYVREENASKKKEGKKTTVPANVTDLETDESARQKKTKKKLTLEAVRKSVLKADLPTGRAPYNRVILRQVFDEVMRGFDPCKAKKDSANPEGEEKPENGCLFQTPEINRYLMGIAADAGQMARDFERWKKRWLSHRNNRAKFEARERIKAGSGHEFVRAEYQAAQSQKWLSQQTNNHIVRHRLVILERLVRDIINDKSLVADGNEKRIGKISIEVARDILAFSGMTREELTGRTLPSLKAHHEYVARKLQNDLKGTQWEHLANSGELIRKAKIADDLGWKCPYTGHPFCACDLASGKMDLDHIIPKSRRLTDAMEALVVTFKAINNIKGDLTAWEFVEKFQGQTIDGVHQPIRKLWDYEQFVKNKDNERDKLRLSGETGIKDYPKWPKYFPGSRTKLHPDYIRRKKRRQYLLIKHYEKDKDRFTPRDLTITSHLNRLAQQVLLRALPHLAEHAVTSIPGGVTGALRDARGWNLLGCLDGAASADVMRILKRRNPQTNQIDEIRVPKPKGEIRELTHLHHALDACVIGIVSHVLPKDGKLWELAAKRELNEADVQSFGELREKYLNQWRPFDLHSLFKIVENRDQNGNLPKHDHKWRIEPMPLKSVLPGIKEQIRNRLRERRVVEHVPADTIGLAAEETVWRVFDPNDSHPSSRRLRRWFEAKAREGKIKKLYDPTDNKDEAVLIVCRKRRDAKGDDKGKTLHDTGKTWRWVYDKVSKTKLIGLKPEGEEPSKLKALKAVKIIGDNFGIALDPKPRIIRAPKIWQQLADLRKENGGKPARILRKGQLLSVPTGGWAGLWRILSPKETQDYGLALDLAYPDSPQLARGNAPIAKLPKDLKPLSCSLTGIDSSAISYAKIIRRPRKSKPTA